MPYRLLNARNRTGFLSWASSSKDRLTISSPCLRYFLYSSARNGASSWQFGHQLPDMLTITTFPWNRGSVFDTVLPSRSGKLKRKGSVGSVTLVKRDGSLGCGSPLAFACSARIAASGLSLFCTIDRVPSAEGVISRRRGRAPEKWLRTNLPSRYVPVSAPVSPSMRRMAADTSAPDCRTMSCQAASPFELVPT